MSTQIEVILLAAGEGRRMKRPEPKTFIPLAGKPVFLHSLERFVSMEEIAGVVLVVPAGREDQARSHCHSMSAPHKLRKVLAGGARRQDSVQNGMAQLRPETELVLVHDAARPFISPELVRRVCEGAGRTGAAVPGIPLVDTLKRINAQSEVEATLERRNLVAVQTPQGFRAELLRQAYQKAWENQWATTDDAGLVERMGAPVTVVEGEASAFKLTTPLDLVLAEAWFRNQPPVRSSEAQT